MTPQTCPDSRPVPDHAVDIRAARGRAEIRPRRGGQGREAGDIDSPRAWDDDLTIDLVRTDENARHRLTLHHGALTHRATRNPTTEAGLTLTSPNPNSSASSPERPRGHRRGRRGVLLRSPFSYVTKPDTPFPMVTP
ncbi:alkyl sulfatase C-terminal domain-containing protein [Streptomyces sp. NPDC055243]|uniref:alkyl sulfatase C-terminal domain-containing protein n=1 Tax=Streptomyces sp. NPDC055243 TaxID=3365720 RepID=UPI0037D3DF9E